MAKPQTFEQWMTHVDFWCGDLAGVSCHDLPDVCYRDWYDAGVGPKAAARRVIRAAKDGAE